MKMSTMILSSALVLTSCIATGTKVDQTLLPQFAAGQPCAAIVQQIGKPPTRTTIHADGTRQLTYAYTQAQMNPVNFVPVVGGLLAGSTTEDTQTVFECDAQGNLLTYTHTQGQSATGTGFVSGGKQ
jgi:YD repeat-containing protein